MQFTSPIIVALLLAVSTTTVTAAQTISNLRSGRKLQDETELNLLRELGACNFPITIQSGDTCEDIVDTCGGLGLGLECDSAGSTYETCNEWATKVTVGDSCKPLTACKVVNGEEDLHAEEYLCGGCGEQYTCCTHPGDAKHPGAYYYCN